MNEAAAREVTLLQAFETAQPASPSWSDDDRVWATRLALQDEAVPGDAEAFIARRAQHAMQRLVPRESAVSVWLARAAWRWRWLAWAALAGVLLGLLADSIGSSQRINLLAPPLVGVLLWNLVVYLLLLGHALAHLLARNTRPGALVRLAQRVLRTGRSLPGLGSVSASASGSARALQSFASLWLVRSAPLAAARAATLLHVGAAALALGLVAGLYLRGLVLDYRAAWESTFLSAPTVHAALGFVLAPAVRLSGIALPDVAAFEALRASHGEAAAGGTAAPWIHLIALTLALVVVLPRALLALAGSLRSRWLARHLALPIDEAYFAQLARSRRGDVARALVVPYASTPGAPAVRELRSVLTPALGDGAQIEIAPTLAFGAEDDAASLMPLPPGTTLAVALFDFGATPEAESQGRFARLLAQQLSTILVIDEAAFRRRFGADAARIAQRRDAWRVFAESLGTLPVFVDLGAPDAAVVQRAVELAMRNPVIVSAA
jgi:hypothetical protein